jgi:hypothetical protein
LDIVAIALSLIDEVLNETERRKMSIDETDETTEYAFQQSRGSSGISIHNRNRTDQPASGLRRGPRLGEGQRHF